MRVGIQADDLIGACDTGAVFAARGLETVVLLEDAPVPSPAPAVLVVDTESRRLPGPEAYARARAAATRLGASHPAVLFKKIDSSLRGAVAAELRGALEGAGFDGVVVALACPAQRRTVIDGVLRVGEWRADAPAVAGNPGGPPTGASVAALVGAAGPHPVVVLPLVTVRRGANAVAARLGRGAVSLVCDAETHADLGILAAATLGRPTLLAGSAGLAAAVAARMERQEAKPVRGPRRPLLVVAGSAHPVTHGQVERLEARGVRGTQISPESEAADTRGSEGGDYILAARAEPDRAPRTGCEVMAARLAEAAYQVLAGGRPPRMSGTRYGAVVLTGDDAAVAVCRALGATGIALGGELEPGLPHGVLLDGPSAGLPVITKAGGFGDPETLVRIWEACA